jgi:nucleotide-binding universal stress UspA family protein
MTILVGYVRSPQGDAAVELALREATFRSTRVLVLNVVQKESILERGRLDDADVASLTARLDASGVPYDLRREESDDAAETLLAAAVEVGADLVVVGLRRRSAAGKLLFGSNAQRILMQAPVPVLTVRAST